MPECFIIDDGIEEVVGSSEVQESLYGKEGKDTIQKQFYRQIGDSWHVQLVDGRELGVVRWPSIRVDGGGRRKTSCPQLRRGRATDDDVESISNLPGGLI